MDPVEVDLRAAIERRMEELGDINCKRVYTFFDSVSRRYTVVCNFLEDMKILYQAKMYSSGNVRIQRVYITKDMVDAFQRQEA